MGGLAGPLEPIRRAGNSRFGPKGLQSHLSALEPFQPMQGLS